MREDAKEFAYYPSADEVDGWVGDLRRESASVSCQAELLEETGCTKNFGVRHMPGYRYVRFEPENMSTFYGYWQPALSTPSPLLVHVPGYGAEISVHPDLVARGYNVLHISPLGYLTPDGADESKKVDDEWPVLPETVMTDGESGYRFWLIDCMLAIQWALRQPEVIPGRISFFGTSQGGGASLLLGSLYSDDGVRCVAADLPFLTNFPLAKNQGAYEQVSRKIEQMSHPASAWRTVGFIDTASHAHRLTFPVLLTAGGSDETCPPHTIEALFQRLPSTRSYTYLDGTGHRYTTQFIPLAAAWFRLYA